MKARTTEIVVHVRRCHVCGTVNEIENQALRKCGKCHKHFAPFFYFNESDLVGLDVDRIHGSLSWDPKGEPPEAVKAPHYRVIYGLSTYW